jgi:hypothetical protein
VRTARLKSDDLPYTGPVVEVPDQGPDPLHEHGASSNGDELGLPQGCIRDLGHLDRATAEHEATGDVDRAKHDAWLRAILAEQVLPERVEIEFERVMTEVFRV